MKDIQIPDAQGVPFSITPDRGSVRGYRSSRYPRSVACTVYTQYPIIRNGLIRNSAEFLRKFKKRALGRSNLRNASKKLKKRSVLRFSKLRNEQYLSFVCNFIFFSFFILEWSTLSVELFFTKIAVLLAKLAHFSCSIMA